MLTDFQLALLRDMVIHPRGLFCWGPSKGAAKRLERMGYAKRADGDGSTFFVTIEGQEELARHVGR